jgi:hypothetical protein
MLGRGAVEWRVVWCAGVLLALPGCSRKVIVDSVAVEVAPDGPKVAEAPEPDRAEFALPSDAGGKLLAKVLAPADDGGRSAETPRPARRRPPHLFEVPQWPQLPPPGSGQVPVLALDGRRKTLRPHLVSSEDLDRPEERVQLPEDRHLPATERARADSADVNEPAPLPVLAQPAADRASLEDPTAEASTAAALAAAMPRRLMPTPFLRLTVPEPYENRRPLTLALPAEATDPVTATPRPPGP